MTNLESEMTAMPTGRQATPAPTSKPRAKARRRPTILPPEWRCPKCGEELCVFAHGRAWCILCDEVELFGDADGGVK